MRSVAEPNYELIMSGTNSSVWLIGMGLTPLVLLLLTAARQDLKSATIPNALVAVGIVVALLLHGVLPRGNGFLSPIPGGLGLLAALQGLAIGFAVLFPAYLVRAMGAGDVKLMAMVGAFLGPNDILPALVGTFLAGGVLALVVALAHGVALQMFRNIAYMLRVTIMKLPLPGLPAIEPPLQSVAKAPYAVAIALGTLGAIAWLSMPFIST